MAEDLERDVALGIIEKVPLNTPTTWCARMVVVPKHDGSPRRTVNFKALNDTYGWNHPGSTSLLAECHQTMLTLELLPVSIFHGIARVLLHLSNKR